MMFRVVSATAALIVVSGGAIALANAGSFAAPEMMFPDRMLQAQRRPDRAPQMGWIKELNLSSDQLQKIRAIRNQYQDRLMNQRRQARQAQQELKQLMASNASSEQIRQKFDQVQSLKQKLEDTRLESILAIRNVLNPEQRQKLTAVMQKYGNRRDRQDGSNF